MPRWSQVPLVRQIQLVARSKWARPTAALLVLLCVMPVDETTAAQVDQYAAFIHASADHVVEKALNYVFSKDRDFQDFLKTPHAKQVSPTLRVRKGPANGAAEQPARKLVAGVESTPSVRAVMA